MNLQLKFFSHTEIPPKKWNEFLLASPQATIFALYEYIGCVCENWESIIIMNEAEEWQAVMPLAKKQKYAWTSVQQPLLTQHWGIFLRSIANKNQSEKNSFEKKIISEMVLALSKANIALFHLHFSPKLPYLLPFHWENYELKTRYTYQISLSSENEMYQNIASSLQRQIKKANKNQLIWEECKDWEGKIFLDLWKKNVENGKNISGVANHLAVANSLRKLIAYFHSSQKGKIFIVKNTDNQVLAAGLFSFVKGICTYHAGCQAQESKDSGAMTFLLWKTILLSKTQECTIFDFEGSMIAGIEHFFRKFGAIPVSYLSITRNKLPFYLKWIQIFLSLRTKRLI